MLHALAIYDSHDAAGRLLYCRCRLMPLLRRDWHEYSAAQLLRHVATSLIAADATYFPARC